MMILPLFLVLAGTLPAPGDTLIEVGPGDRLVVSYLEGSVTVEGWDRSAVLVEAGRGEFPEVRLRRVGDKIEVRPEPRGDAEDDHRIRLPFWMGVGVSGRDLDVEIRGTEGEVSVRTLDGDILLRDLAGAVEAVSSDGEVEAIGLTGTAILRTGDDDLWVTRSSGSLELETVDGDLILEGLRSSRVRLRTTDGDVAFSGALLKGGEYRFSTHGGDVQLRLEGPVHADARILAYDGELESDFPIRATGYRSGEPLRFVLGDGGARLEVETFDGEVRILRAGGGWTPAPPRAGSSPWR